MRTIRFTWRRRCAAWPWRRTPSSPRPPSPHATRDLRKPGVSQKWALVVGIARFRQPRLNLRYTRKDADAMAALLKDPVYGQFRPDHVQVIEDEEATTVKIRAAINWLARSANEDDLAVIYIASHGTAREEDVAGVSYIVTHDTDMETHDGLYSTAISMVDISNAVRTRLKAFRVVVILDTCHSAGAVTQTVAVPQSLSPKTMTRFARAPAASFSPPAKPRNSHTKTNATGMACSLTICWPNSRNIGTRPSTRFFRWSRSVWLRMRQRNIGSSIPCSARAMTRA
jgi:hypothetical protein